MPLKGYYRNELEKVDKGSKRLREVMDGLSPAFFVGMLTVEGVMTYTNRTSLEAIGLELKDVIGRRFEDTPWWAYSELYRQQLREAIARAVEGEASRFDLMCQSLDGRLLTLDFSLNPVFDAKKNVSYLVPSAHDVTKRRAAERALSILRVCNNALLRAHDETVLLIDICQLIVAEGGYQMAWVGLIQHDDAKTVKPIAHANQCKEKIKDFTDYLSQLNISWSASSPLGQGIAGQCIRSNQVVVCPDVRINSSMSYWQKKILEQGAVGVITLPLRQEQHVFGVLALYTANVIHISDDELTLLQELADNLAYGIMTLRTKHENQRVLSAVHAIAEGVSTSTGHQFFEKLALNMTESLGAQVGIISCLQEGEPLTSRTIVVVVDGQVMENFDIPIAGTPCEKLSEWDEVIEAVDVARRYPRAKTLAALSAEAYIGRRIDSSLGKPLGQVFVLYRQPLEHTGFVSAILKIFAARIAAELERQV